MLRWWQFQQTRHFKRWPASALPRLFFLYGRIIFRGWAEPRCTRNGSNLTSASAINGKLHHSLADITATQGSVEVDYAPANATTETIKKVFFRIDAKAWRALFVQGTEAFPVRAVATQRPSALAAISEKRVGGDDRRAVIT